MKFLTKKVIAIIGGGAAGMMTAATLAQNSEDKKILLFEKNTSLGAKVIISGGGRCNLTTGYTRRQDLKDKYTRGWEFYQASLKKFTPKSVYKRFEENGVPCKTEEDLRVFPVSNDGKDVVRMFEQILNQGGVEIKYNEGIKDIQKNDNKFLITSDSQTYQVDQVVLTTGGNAFSHTGSSGDGYNFASTLGHTITPLGPSLNSFVTKQDRLHSLSGLSFPDAGIYIEHKNIKKEGPVLLTHFGISGPLTFIVASETAFTKITEESSIEVLLQPISDLDYYYRNSYLLESSQTSKKELISILANKLPKRFCEVLLAEIQLPMHTPISQISKKDRKFVSDLLGNGIPLSLIKRRPGDEFVTAGGVNSKEIHPDTLESKVCPGLYFAGEILNIDGVTGGYNLQMCWSTGRCVGRSISEK